MQKYLKSIFNERVGKMLVVTAGITAPLMGDNVTNMPSLLVAIACLVAACSAIYTVKTVYKEYQAQP